MIPIPLDSSGAPCLGSPDSLLGSEPQLVHLQDGEVMLAWRASQGACLSAGVLTGLAKVFMANVSEAPPAGLLLFTCSSGWTLLTTPEQRVTPLVSQRLRSLSMACSFGPWLSGFCRGMAWRDVGSGSLCCTGDSHGHWGLGAPPEAAEGSEPLLWGRQWGSAFFRGLPSPVHLLCSACPS